MADTATCKVQKCMEDKESYLNNVYKKQWQDKQEEDFKTHLRLAKQQEKEENKRRKEHQARWDAHNKAVEYSMAKLGQELSRMAAESQKKLRPQVMMLVAKLKKKLASGPSSSSKNVKKTSTSTQAPTKKPASSMNAAKDSKKVRRLKGKNKNFKPSP